MNKIVITLFVVLSGGLAALQVEIVDTQSKIAQAIAANTAAMQKFERDLAARDQAAHNLAAIEDMQRRKVIDQGLQGVPTGNFRQPVLWKDTVPKQ